VLLLEAGRPCQDLVDGLSIGHGVTQRGNVGALIFASANDDGPAIGDCVSRLSRRRRRDGGHQPRHSADHLGGIAGLVCRGDLDDVVARLKLHGCPNWNILAGPCGIEGPWNLDSIQRDVNTVQGDVVSHEPQNHDVVALHLRVRRRIVDRDHRDADVGENVDRCAERRERAHDRDQQGQHDERIWTPQRNADDANHAENAPQSRDKSRAAPVAQRSCRTEHIAPHQSSYRIVSYFSRSVQLTKALPPCFWGAASGVCSVHDAALLVFCAPHNFWAATLLGLR